MKNNSVSVPLITFEHPSMDESEAKFQNDQLKSDSQEELNEDDMEQANDVFPDALTTPKIRISDSNCE